MIDKYVPTGKTVHRANAGIVLGGSALFTAMILGTNVYPAISPLGVHNAPLQWSQNQQLAINSGNYVHILDSLLPLLVSLVISKDYSGRTRLLDLKQIFNFKQIINKESYEEDQLPLGRFRNFIISQGREKFAFSSFNDIGVVSVKWTPPHPTTKQCDLAAIFSTGECLIFSRDTLTVNSVTVKVDLFDWMLRRINIEYQESEDVFYGSASQYESLKVKAVEFNLLETTMQLLIALASHELTLLNYGAAGELSVVTASSTDPEKEAIKFYWLPYKTGTLKLAVVYHDNSVVVATVTPDSIGEFTEIIAPQVRLHHLLEWVAPLILISAFQKTIVVAEADGDNYSTYSYTLESPWSLAGMACTNKGMGIEVVVAFDNGTFELCVWDASTKQFTTSDGHKELTQFVTKSLEQFQMNNSTAEDTEDVEEATVKRNKPDNAVKSELMRTYLDPRADGRFIVQGFSLHDDFITMIYLVVPKNALIYTIALETETAVAFIRLLDQKEPVTIEHNEVASTTIAKLNLMWFAQFNELPPPFPPANAKKYSKYAFKYLQTVKTFMDTHFLQPDAADLNVTPCELLETGLIEQYTLNPQVQGLQKLTAIYRMVKDVAESFCGVDEWKGAQVGDVVLTQLAQQLQTEATENMSKVEVNLRVHLALLVLSSISEVPLNEWDAFFVLNLYNFLWLVSHDTSAYDDRVPESATIVVETKYLTQSFTIEKQSKWASYLITLTAGQPFAVCELTGFPILELNNKKDELKQYNFKLHRWLEYGPITLAVARAINYLFLDGNRTFAYLSTKA